MWDRIDIVYSDYVMDLYMHKTLESSNTIANF